MTRAPVANAAAIDVARFDRERRAPERLGGLRAQPHSLDGGCRARAASARANPASRALHAA